LTKLQRFHGFLAVHILETVKEELHGNLIYILGFT